MRLRVLTWNIHRCIGVDRRFRPERVVEVLRHYQAHVVLLQEVDEGVPRSRELNLAREIAGAAEYPFFALGHNVSLRKGWYGNATLSRFPILRERNIDLTIGWHKRRGCQHTTLELPPPRREASPRRLEVFNLHLGLSARERTEQVEVLLGSEEVERLDDDTPSLVGGDFNDWRSLIEPVFHDGLGFGSATRLKRGMMRTYPSFSPRGGLDRLYFRGDGLRLTESWTCRLQISRVASDHLPVIADFRLRAR